MVVLVVTQELPVLMAILVIMALVLILGVPVVLAILGQMEPLELRVAMVMLVLMVTQGAQPLLLETQTI